MPDTLPATDPIALTRRLIAFDTVNPPGNELACAQYLADLLQAAGFETRLVPLGPEGGGRANLLARKGTPGPNGPLVFTGHIDVVPLGTRAWSQQPFGGARASGTNDKAGSILNLYRWLSARTIKEVYVPVTDYKYPFVQEA